MSDDDGINSANLEKLAYGGEALNYSAPSSFAAPPGSGAAELRCPKCKGNVIYKDLITGKQYQCDECGECFNQERQPPLPNDKMSRVAVTDESQ